MRKFRNRLSIGCRSIAAISLGILLTTVIATEASAAPPDDSSGLSSDAATARAQLMDQLVHLRTSGATEDAIDRVLEARFGLERKSIPPSLGITPLAYDPGEISVPPPGIYYDPQLGKYYVLARWDFANVDDLPLGWFCGECPVGGEDAFGFVFSRNVSSVSGYALSTWGNLPSKNNYPAASRMHVVQANVSGVGYAGQDKGRKVSDNGPDYSFMHGQLVYTINTPGCGQLQAFSTYGHTWSSTGVSGVSIAPWNISISFSSTSNRWTKTSQPSGVVTPC